MSAVFTLKKEPPKKQIFHFKGVYFVMCGSIDMNVGMFSETSVAFLKSVEMKFFQKYS